MFPISGLLYTETWRTMRFIKGIFCKLVHLIPSIFSDFFAYTISYTTFYVIRVLPFSYSLFISFSRTIYKVFSKLINDIFDFFQLCYLQCFLSLHSGAYDFAHTPDLKCRVYYWSIPVQLSIHFHPTTSL